MTYHYNYWSAFTEADLLKDGDYNLGKGDSFTMPGSATVTLASWDNDSQLSGDYCDKATDNDGQYDQYGWAYINNCWVKTGDLYVEKVWTLIGSDGKTYHLAEIEGEGYNAPGAGDDFFSFVGATPPAGVTLTVKSCANSSGVNYSDLSADPSEPPANSAPAFTNAPSNGVIHINENETAVIDLDASDDDGDTLTFEIVGGRDAAFFEIDPHTGVLTFKNAPDYENPQSGGDSNTYDVTVKVSDGNGGEEVKPLWVKVKDVEEETMDCIVIEAEDMHKWNFSTVHGSNASGGELVRVNHLGQSGDLSTSFSGSDGTYTISVFAQDENDGQSVIMVKVNGEVVGTINLDNDNNGGGSNDGHFSEFTIEGVELNDGDNIQLWAQSDRGEYVRIDKIKLQQTEDAPGFRECDDPDAVNIDFEGFAAGTVIDTQYDGVMISAQRTKNNTAENDAMIFDSNNPTGGDSDLATASQGNILIVSEDNDSSDPDDAVGGTIWFKFDNPSYIYDIKVVDAEEGGLIRLLDENGALIEEVIIPNGTDGGLQQVLIDVDGVAQIDLTLNGSGAIDDLCYVPGEAPLGSIAGTYFMDNNDNSVEDGGDMGLAGQTVWLLAAGQGIVATTTTDANGDYIFTDLEAGSYSVRFDGNNVEGKEFVEGNVGDDDTIDSDVTLVGSANNGNTDFFDLGAGEDITNVDAGVEVVDTADASIAGVVFMDNNDDSLNNDGDMPIGGVTVTLTDANGNFLDETVTLADGSYEFTGLPAGDYKVDFPTEIDGKVLVDQNAGDDTIDSDADQTTGETGVISLAIGERSENNDAGVEDPGTASVGNLVFLDNDGNGVFNAGDEVVEGVTVELLNADGDVIASDTTDDQGNYLFDGLDAGIYSVRFTAPDGLEFTSESPFADDEANDDSDANEMTGETEQFELSIGEAERDIDAGLVTPEPASVGDTVFLDINGNGVNDDGEPGVEGVEVTLTGAGDDGIIGTADDTTETTTTDANGNYLFDDLEAGDYKITFNAAAAGAFVFTAEGASADALVNDDSDADEVTGMTDVFTLVAGQDERNIDAGVVSEDPNAADDAAMTCANEEVTVDVLANDTDDEPLTITEVGGQEIVEGQTVVVDGVNVTLSGGQLVFDGEAAYESLDIGESATATISYTVSDGLGGEAMADVDVTFCGVAETVTEICESLPAQITYKLKDGYKNGDTSAYDMQISSTDARLDGLTIVDAFCVSALDLASTGTTFQNAPSFTADLYCTENVPASVLEGQVGSNGQSAADNLDLITWILNQDFNSADYAGAGFVDGVTEAEVQAAVWNLTDGTDFIGPDFGQIEDARLISQLAQANGEGFEAGPGGVVGLVVDPNPATASNSQPFIIGVNFDDLDCIC